jgi:dihydrofolate reductase
MSDENPRKKDVNASPVTHHPSRISIIVAMAKNRVIGAKGAIPWRLPEELKLFRILTMGHHLIMGRKTYESIGRLLPGRTSVIVTRQPGYRIEGAIVVHSLDAAIAACANDDEIFVIGGEGIFRAALPLADRLYLTTVDAEVAGDTYMPGFSMDEWSERSVRSYEADERNPHAFRFSIYERIQH